MAFTDSSDLFAALHEDGLNRVLGHVMRQRPSLFNYATSVFNQIPEHLCVPIDAAPEVADSRNPLLTEQDPLPVVGAVQPRALDFCVQITDISIDLHPGNTLSLPQELGTLAEQQFALHLQACVGIDCLSEVQIRNILAEAEVAMAAGVLAAEKPPTPTTTTGAGGFNLPGSVSLAGASAAAARGDRRAIPGDLLCMCLHAFGVGHFEWDTILERQWLKVLLDGLEIVDLETVPPSSLEEMAECYLRLVLRLGILPQLMTPMESLVLDITEMLLDNDVKIREQITLAPTPTPSEVPHNPAVEGDQLKAFIDLNVEAS